jgi:hypothetical protein
MNSLASPTVKTGASVAIKRELTTRISMRTFLAGTRGCFIAEGIIDPDVGSSKQQEDEKKRL